jgi:hypothetical protein
MAVQVIEYAIMLSGVRCPERSELLRGIKPPQEF